MKIAVFWIVVIAAFLLGKTPALILTLAVGLYFGISFLRAGAEDIGWDGIVMALVIFPAIGVGVALFACSAYGGDYSPVPLIAGAIWLGLCCLWK